MSNVEVRLAPVVASLALATEAAAGVPPETASRAAIIASALSSRLGMSADEQRAVFYASLLRYIGCTAFAHEAAFYSDGNDIGFLRGFAPADSTKPTQLVAHALRGLAPGKGALARARAAGRMLGDPDFGAKLARAHGDQAAHLAVALGAPAPVAAVLSQAYERFDGKGAPGRLARESIHPLARVMHVAYCVVLHASFAGLAQALEVVRSRRGSELDPAMADQVLAMAGELLPLLGRGSVWEILPEFEPAPAQPLLNREAVARAFGDFVDLKSPYLLGHSTGVATLFESASAWAGATPTELAHARIAGLLHDLGRASVPNAIWDKPGPLNALEREHARAHAAQTERILERAGLVPGLVELVGLHHERLDGSGYPRRTASSGLDRAARLLSAADVYQALRQDRAHRPAFEPERAADLLNTEANAGRLDREAVGHVLSAAGGVSPRLRVDSPGGLDEREVEVLLLLARGLSHKQIGERLFSSPRTVGHQIADIYDKTAVRTRASAALFAVQHHLLEDRPS